MTPIDYRRYPPNWKWLSKQVRKRAQDRCEICGLPNGVTVRRWKKNPAVAEQEAPRHDWDHNWSKPVKIVLTVAHLDHDPENHAVKPERLLALCQRCHLNLDRKWRPRHD